MTRAATLSAIAALVVMLAPALAPAQAAVIGHREHDNTSGLTASVEVPLAPVLGQALTRAGLPEAQALQPCSSGWPSVASPIFAPAMACAWVASQVQAACVVSAAETALADHLTGRVWPSAAALQDAADKAARGLDLRRLRGACQAPDAASITPITGDEVKAQIGARLAYSCGPDGVTIARDGATFFGGGVIDGRQYKVGLERGSSNKSSVGGAFLSP